MNVLYFYFIVFYTVTEFTPSSKPPIECRNTNTGIHTVCVKLSRRHYFVAMTMYNGSLGVGRLSAWILGKSNPASLK